jgi:hypothetical protein
MKTQDVIKLIEKNEIEIQKGNDVEFHTEWNKILRKKVTKVVETGFKKAGF